MKKSLLTAACTMGLGLVPALAQGDLAPPRCDYGAPNENAPEELSQFAFLIGDYTISAHAWQNDAWTPPRPGTPARWNGYYGLEGMAIVDEWYGRDPGIEPETGRGINVRMWDAEEGEWDMMWIATAGRQVQDLRAKVMDGVLTMWQVYPTQIDLVADFFVEDEDHWHRISYVQDDEGEWQPQFKLRATRLSCAADSE